MPMKYLDEQKIPSDWYQFLASEFKSSYMKNLDLFLKSEVDNGKKIFPKKSDIFNALKFTPLNDVKVVIIGQDPYHGENQAHGLSFSVLPGIKSPPSLVNIYKEIQSEYDLKIPNNGHLKSWADQGVLLLNCVLTVEASKANSHQKKGWELFTDKIVDILNENCSEIVFILWGSYAQTKGKDIDENKHYVLKGPHPSPLSAYRGFFGCNHFKLANEYLISKNKKPINWAIKDLVLV